MDMDWKQMLVSFFGGGVAMTVVKLAAVGIGWHRREDVLWPRPMLQYRWRRARFRDLCAALTFVVGVGLLVLGYFTMPLGQALLWMAGVALAWWYDILPTVVLGLLQRYEIEPSKRTVPPAVPPGAASGTTLGGQAGRPFGAPREAPLVPPFPPPDPPTARTDNRPAASGRPLDPYDDL